MRNSLSFAVICRVITNLTGVAIAFISLRLYKLYLTKEIYGTVLVATQFMTYLPLISGGFGMILGQQMLSSRDRDVVVKTARYTQILQSHILVLALAGGLIIMMVYSQTPAARSVGLPLPLYFAMGLAGAATFYSGGQVGMLTGLGRQVYTIILNGTGSVLGLLILALAFVAGGGVWAMPISSGLGAVLLVPVAWYVQQRLIPGLPTLSWHRDADFWPKLKEIWFPALTWLQSQFSIMFLFTMDIILMGMLFGPGAATIYGIVSRVTAMSRQVIQTLSDTAWPRFTQELDLERKAELMRKVDRLSAWIAGSWYGAMAATLQAFLGWLIKDWAAGSLLIYLVVGRNMVVSLSSPHSYGLLSGGRFKELARVTQMEIIASLAAIFLLSHFLGMIGLALGVLLGTCGGSLWYTTYLYFKPSARTPWFGEWCAIYLRGTGSAVLGFTVASLVWWGEKTLFHAPGCMAIVAGGAGLAAGMGVAILFGLIKSGGKTRSLGPVKIPTNW